MSQIFNDTLKILLVTVFGLYYVSLILQELCFTLQLIDTVEGKAMIQVRLVNSIHVSVFEVSTIFPVNFIYLKKMVNKFKNFFDNKIVPLFLMVSYKNFCFLNFTTKIFHHGSKFLNGYQIVSRTNNSINRNQKSLRIFFGIYRININIHFLLYTIFEHAKNHINKKIRHIF